MARKPTLPLMTIKFGATRDEDLMGWDRTGKPLTRAELISMVEQHAAEGRTEPLAIYVSDPAHGFGRVIEDAAAFDFIERTYFKKGGR